VLADANAIAGIYYLHGSTQDLDDTALNGLKSPTNTIYYQSHGDTEYYLIPTDELPILMPFNGIVPDPVLKALDPPLRYLVELGYDRDDYSTPTPAGLVPNLNPATVATGLAAATVQGVETGLGSSGVAVPAMNNATTRLASTPTDSSITKVLPKADVPKLIPPKRRIASSPLSNTLTAPKATTKAGNTGPVKSIQSAIKSLTKNLAPKAKPAAAKDPSSDS
jgi:hypothetical protein